MRLIIHTLFIEIFKYLNVQKIKFQIKQFLDSIFTRNQPFDCVSPCSRSLLLFSVSLISQVCLFIYDN